MILLDSVEEVSSDLVSIKGEQCIVLRTRNDTKIVLTNTVSDTSREQHQAGDDPAGQRRGSLLGPRDIKGEQCIVLRTRNDTKIVITNTLQTTNKVKILLKSMVFVSLWL